MTGWNPERSERGDFNKPGHSVPGSSESELETIHRLKTGALFRSSSFLRQETELVILVTPYVSRPVDDPAALRSPADGYTAPNDLERILLLRQVGATPGMVPPSRIPGRAGFIVQ